MIVWLRRALPVVGALLAEYLRTGGTSFGR